MYMFKRNSLKQYRDSFRPFVVNREGQCCKHPAAVQETPTTLFSDRPITPSRQYNWVVGHERRKLLFILAMLLVVSPLIFRYACGSSNDDTVDSASIAWASDLDAWEWVILVVMWANVLGFIFRLLPVVTGGPSAVESSRVCKLDGVAALGLCSPFSSEDDIILLRSLLGRTCTVLHTAGGRHSIQGFYVDAVLNERRIKGEAHRRNLWLAWMKFLHSLVDVSLLIKEEGGYSYYLPPGKDKKQKQAESKEEFQENLYRPLYTQGDANTRGVKDAAQLHRSPPTSFKDVGALLDTTRGVSEEHRQRVSSWGKDRNNARPLSRGMATASSPNSSPRASGAGNTAEAANNKRARSTRLEQIAEQDGEEEEKDLEDGGYPGAGEGEKATVPVKSALESEEVGDEDIELAAFRCSTDDVDPAGGDMDPRDEAAFSDKSASNGSGNGSGRRLSPAINGPQVVSASGADKRASRGIVLDYRSPPPKGTAIGGAPTSAGQEGSGRGPVAVGEFVITPNKKPRPLSTREAVISSAYLRPHGISNLELNMSDLVPMIHLLDAWLNELKEHESGYDYFNPKSALEKVFFACPFMTHFKGQHMLAVHAALDALYDAFTTKVSDEPDPRRPYHPDEISEVEWVLHRENLPDWTVVWCYASRARLRELKRSEFKDPVGPDPVFESTRVKAGTIVYRVPPRDVMPEYAPTVYFRTRQSLYKVTSVDMVSGSNVHLVPFCPTKPPAKLLGNRARDMESGTKAAEGVAGDAATKEVILPLQDVVLLEKNRGKTGALNFFNEYLRGKTYRWRRSLGMRHPVQTFTGIVDARHMIVETDIFWNDALPHFAMLDTGGGGPGRRVGSLTEHSICISVQYPQHFSNVGNDDVLDNSNSVYYTLWQTLRDCSKCICSSGSNTIWDISHPWFEFCTKSRSEDLGTSHEYIPHCEAVYLCSFVAYGIAKRTEDFLDALYRWAAGPLELLWPGFFQMKIAKHFIRTAVPSTIFALASFHENPGWYYLHLAVVVLLCVRAFIDYCAGNRQLRYFIVSTVIASNLFNNLSNIMSVTWYVIFPIRMAFFGVLPLGRTQTQGLFWAWVSLFITFPTGLVHDGLVHMVRTTAPDTKKMHFNHSLWRGTQLYANSFMYTVQSTMAGTYSAFKAWAFDRDLSMWSSFKVNQAEFAALSRSVDDVHGCSFEYCVFVYKYMMLYLNSCLAALTQPTVMTKWYVTAVFILQIVCFFVSTFIVNRGDVIVLAMVSLMSALNILMTVEAVLLLQPPGIKIPCSLPIRTEYIFSLVGVGIIISAVINDSFSMDVVDRLRLGNVLDTDTAV